MLALKPLKVYLSGPMRGIPESNFPAFDKAKKYLQLILIEGSEIISPADHDREMGYDPTVAPQELDDKGLPASLNLAEVIMWDLEAVAKCDLVFMLKGWFASQGARLEHDLARFLGKTIIFEDSFPT